MRGVSNEELAAAFQALQVDRDRRSPAWRTVVAYVVGRFPTFGDPTREDARQETLITVVRSIDQLRNVTSRSAPAWLRRVAASRMADAQRAAQRERQHYADVDPADLGAPDGTPRGLRAARELARTLAAVESHVPEARTARSRQRDHARAALLRLCLGWDQREIAAALAGGDAPTTALVDHWISLGRGVVLEAVDAWVTAAPPAEREDVERVAEVLRDLMTSRAPTTRRTAA